MENWKYIGALFTGLAALLTASISVFNYFDSTVVQSKTRLTDSIKHYAVINDPDGWVNLRTAPTTNSPILYKIENGYKVEILQKNGNWFQVKTSIGDIGFIYTNRFVIQN
jgi:uncharacterized protein YgiM (DUF1202 family)